MTLNNHYKLKPFVGDYNELLAYIEAIDASFYPKLSTSVNIVNYVQKIYDKAIISILESDSQFAGLYAIYFNKEVSSHFTYISLISVLDKYKGKGAAQFLMNDIVRRSVSERISEIQLEVRFDNLSAIGFYKKNDFELMVEKDPSELTCYMTKKIKCY